MVSLKSGHPGGLHLPALRDWEKRLHVSPPEERRGPPTRLLIAGAVVVGLGIVAWTYLGPDLRRYLKIHNM